MINLPLGVIVMSLSICKCCITLDSNLLAINKFMDHLQILNFISEKCLLWNFDLSFKKTDSKYNIFLMGYGTNEAEQFSNYTLLWRWRERGFQMEMERWVMFPTSREEDSGHIKGSYCTSMIIQWDEEAIAIQWMPPTTLEQARRHSS